MYKENVNIVANSLFRQPARLVTIGDICTPFIATFDARRSAADVAVELTVDLCCESGLDPMEQIALVGNVRKILGWVSYADLYKPPFVASQ